MGNAAPERVREGDSPPTQPSGVYGEQLKLPHRAWGRFPEANAFCSKHYAKKAAARRPFTDYKVVPILFLHVYYLRKED